MSQATTNETNKVSDQSKAFGNKVVDSARNAVDTAKGAAHDTMASTAAAVEKQGHKATDAALNEINKVSDQSKAFGNKVADGARNVADTAKNATHDVVASATAAVDKQSHKATDAAHHAVDATRAGMEKASRGGADLATFWIQTMQEQVTQNVEVMQQLAAAHSWQDKMKVQTDYFAGSLSRLQDVFSRYMNLAGNTTDDMVSTGAAVAKKAA